MGDSHGRVGILFVVVMGLSAAAAVPFMNHQPPPAPDDVAILPQETGETTKEAEPARHAPNTKPKPRSIRTARWTGGESNSTKVKPQPQPTRTPAGSNGSWNAGGGQRRPTRSTTIKC